MRISVQWQGTSICCSCVSLCRSFATSSSSGLGLTTGSGGGASRNAFSSISSCMMCALMHHTMCSRSPNEILIYFTDVHSIIHSSKVHSSRVHSSRVHSSIQHRKVTHCCSWFSAASLSNSCSAHCT